jgi:hypothetical protein
MNDENSSSVTPEPEGWYIIMLLDNYEIDAYDPILDVYDPMDINLNYQQNTHDY